jgi:hypothetical protein
LLMVQYSVRLAVAYSLSKHGRRISNWNYVVVSGPHNLTRLLAWFGVKA